MKNNSVSRTLEQWIKKLKCSGSSGIGLETFTDIRVGVDPSPLTEEALRFPDPVTNDDVRQCLGAVTTTPGGDMVTLDISDELSLVTSLRGGLRHGRCELYSCHGDIETIKGDYRDGQLHGRAKIVYSEGQSIDGYFREGVLHGFARYFDEVGRLRLLGNHRDGLAVGTCWRVIRGGGCVVGEVDERGELTGDSIAYIYPDYKTALRGRFDDGVLVEAHEAEVTGAEEDEAGIMVPIFSKCVGETHFRQCRPASPFGVCPRLRDPYEAKMVEVQGSEIEDAAEGLFALQDIETNTVVAFYNGTVANMEDYDPDTWETNCYKIFDPADMPDGTIDIPVWAQSSSEYCATLAHKTNHSFLPNSQFLVFEHPKYGLIPCISTISDIAKGEEVLVAYGYDWSEAPEWYKETWSKS